MRTRAASMICWLRGGQWLLAVSFVAFGCSQGVGQGYPSTALPPAVPTSPPVSPGPNGGNPYGVQTPQAQPEIASLPPQGQRFQPQRIGQRQFEPTEILAKVGSDAILACDIMPDIDRHFSQFEGRVPAEQLAAERENAIRMLLEGAVQQKLICLNFLRQVPEEMMPQLEERVFVLFNEKQLPFLMERFEKDTPAELDAFLREGGSSLAQQRRIFRDKMIASEAMRSATSAERVVNHEEMLVYYQDHLAEFSFESEARWEQLMVRFENYPNKSEAFRTLANMGNEVLRGAPLEVIARRSSEGPHREDGGQFDWTTQGSLASTTLDEAIFTLPVGSLSPILEDDSGFHIVRVIERREAGHTPFREAQVEIKEKILEEYREGKIEEFLDSLDDSVVWTIFDDMPEDSQGSMASEPGAAPR